MVNPEHTVSHKPIHFLWMWIQTRKGRPHGLSTLHSGGYNILSWCQWYTRLPLFHVLNSTSLLFFGSHHSNRYEVILPFNFSMAKDTKHIVILLLSICMSSLENCPLGPFAHFDLGYYVYIALLLSELGQQMGKQGRSRNRISIKD